ncbi:MAG: hypothetical protein HKM95_01865 [Inquilinus sp.]|nr:hypothetical protein [Inquilinus sp.]
MIDGVWYRRYRADGFLARGLGRYWYEGGQLHFRRFLIKTPVVIPLDSVIRVDLKAWHAGRWALQRRIVVLVWRKGMLELHSGFVFSNARREIDAALATLEAEIAAAKSSG